MAGPGQAPFDLGGGVSMAVAKNITDKCGAIRMAFGMFCGELSMASMPGMGAMGPMGGPGGPPPPAGGRRR